MADHYVWSGATGAGTGADWTNAYTDLPASLVRGDTYHVAGGTYGIWTFNDAESGSSLITIIKAQSSTDSGVAGWQASFSTTEAVATNLIFIYSYYTLNGVTGGGPGAWDTGFGFRIHSSDTTQTFCIIRGTNWSTPPLPTHITFSHIDFEGQGYLSSSTIDDGFQAACGFTGPVGEGSNNLTIQYCYVHDLSYGHIGINIGFANKVVIEYTMITRNSDNATYHSDGIMLDGCNDVDVRYCYFKDVAGSGVISIGQDITGTTTNNNILTYGNIFYDSPGFGGTDGGGNGVFAHIAVTGSGYAVTNCAFYNNTMVGLVDNSDVYLPEGDGNIVENNLWVDCVDSSNNPNVVVQVSSTSTIDYNTYINSLKYDVPGTGSHDETLASGDPFIDIAAADFRLAAHTTAGIDVSSTFTFDMLSHLFSTVSWDRGALAYGSAVGAQRSFRMVM